MAAHKYRNKPKEIIEKQLLNDNQLWRSAAQQNYINENKWLTRADPKLNWDDGYKI